MLEMLQLPGHASRPGPLRENSRQTGLLINTQRPLRALQGGGYGICGHSAHSAHMNSFATAARMCKPRLRTCRAIQAPSIYSEAGTPSFGLTIQSIADITVEDHPAEQGGMPKSWTKPYMLLLPDLDGVGVTSSKSWSSIAMGMDLQVLRIDTCFQGSFNDLVEFAASHLATVLADAALERPTFLLGEGFGGVLAIAVTLACRMLFYMRISARKVHTLSMPAPARCQYVNRVVLVNPATCLRDAPIKRIGPMLAAMPANVMQGAPLALLPLLGGSPLDLMGQVMARSSGQHSAGSVKPGHLAANALQVLLGALEQLQQLSRHLPQATLTARLALLDQGLEYIDGRLAEVETRVMVLAGGRDFLPSSDEAKRLAADMPRAFAKVLPEAGHALLLDPGVDLLGVMREEGFLVDRRRFTSAIKPGAQVLFGAPGPIELPSKQEVARAGRELTTPLRQMCSPVFLSTLPDGTVVEGLAGLDTAHRPLLFVGNHQLFALDMNLLVEEIYLQKGILLRGLAHPALFTANTARAAAATAAAANTTGTSTSAATSTNSSSQHTKSAYPGNSSHQSGADDLPGRQEAALNNAVPIPATARKGRQHQTELPPVPAAAPVAITAPLRLGDLYRTFGAVIVTPSAFFRLLAAGEAVLLYPGGVREGFKRRDEKYELFWPEKGEFVRMAARHEAWVIPVSAVGWEDSISIVMDTDEIARHPWLGAAARAASDATPRARDGTAEMDETFIPPFIAPSVPARLYFLLGRPMQLSKHMATDRAQADQTYREIKAAVKNGISWLLERREQDPYKQLVSRLVFENNPVGAKRQAPTFQLGSRQDQQRQHEQRV